MSLRRIKSLKQWPFLVTAFLAFTLSGCGSTVSSLLRPDQPLPGHLANQPSPKNIIPLQVSEIDAVRQLDNSQLLITGMATGGFMQNYMLYEKDMQMLDMVVGKRLWKISFAEMKIYVEDVTVTADHIILVGSDRETWQTKVFALNRESGITDWEYVADKAVSSTQYQINESARNIIFANSTGPVIDVWAIDLTNGQQIWETDIKARANEKNFVTFSLQSIQDLMLLKTDKFVALNVMTGKPAWTSIAASLGKMKDVKYVVRGPWIFAFSKQKLLAIDPKRQKVVWSMTAKKGDFIAPALVGSSLLVSERREKDLIVRRIDNQLRTQRWVSTISDARSPVFIRDQYLYYTTQKHLVKMDFAQGKVKARYTLPDYLQTEDGLADVLNQVKGNIIVAREAGVAAFDARNGRLKFTQAVYGGQAFSFDFLEAKLRLRSLARQGGISDPGQLVSAIGQAHVDMLYGMSTGYNQAAAESMGYQVSGSSMALASSVQLLGSVLTMSSSFREGAVSSNMDINKRQIEAALASQQYSVQHGYYVRPFYDRGWGVTLVRLDNGQRADLYVSPDNIPLKVNSGNYPLFLIDPVNKQLIAKGTGLRPDPGHSYEKVAFDDEIYKSWPGIPNKWIIPYASILTYDLNKLSFGKTGRSLPVLARIGKIEQSLREAVMKNDLPRVKQLIASGADVNAVDRYGFNILFYAAMMDKKEMVAYLIGQGADATQRDAHGWLAYHYTFMTRGMNLTTELFRDAHLKQTSQ